MNIFHTRRHALVALAALCAAPALYAAPADDFPNRPITLVVPATPGGMLDAYSRGLAKLAQPFLNNQPVIIENRPGASMLMGADALARMDHGDGYTLTTSLAIWMRMPHMRKVNYDPLKDFTWIISLAGGPMGIAVRTDAPYKSMADLVAAAKARPGELSYGTVGVGNGGHLLMEELGRQKGVKFNMIPMKGSSEVIQAVLGGHVDVMSDSTSWAPQVRSGKMRLLMQWGPKRLAQFPDTPTATELGIPVVYNSPIGIAGPKNMDPRITMKLHDAFRQAAQTPEYQQLLTQLELVSVYRNPKDFEADMRQAYQDEQRMLERLGLLQAF